MDLAAINIQRGRDLGLGSLNQTRVALGLAAYTSFTQISSDLEVATSLQAAYGDINQVDLWIGGLAEDHVNGGMVGQTFNVIISNQFQALRDGDRLWYENQGFDRNTLNQINNTSLSDLIKLNTDTKYIQADVFEYSERRVGTSAPENPLAPQLIIGVDGIDNLIGGDANDILVAGLGNQKLKGGAGRDKFVLSQPGLQAQVLDFSPGIDQLVFEQASNRNQLNRGISITRQGANTLLNFGGADVTLIGILPNQIRPGDLDNMI
jgi:Ca2+-binding RTX toxin-like protein